MRYRCLELLSQQRLATYGVWTAEPSFDNVRERFPALEDLYQKAQRDQGFHRQYPLPSPDRSIGLFDGYMLLQALGDPLVRDWNIGDIRQRSYARNTSILAHGFRPISQQEYTQFADIVEGLLDRFLVLIRRSRQQWEHVHRFVSLALRGGDHG